MSNFDEVYLDSTTLATAIASASNKEEFANLTKLQPLIVMTMIGFIRHGGIPIRSGADVTVLEAYAKMFDFAHVAHELNFFSLQ